MTHTLYILDSRSRPVAVEDPGGWMDWLERNRTKADVGRKDYADGSYVSTVFIGIDRDDLDPPRPWETLVADARQGSAVTVSYPTLAAAKEGHRRAVIDFERMRNG